MSIFQYHQQNMIILQSCKQFEKDIAKKVFYSFGL